MKCHNLSVLATLCVLACFAGSANAQLPDCTINFVSPSGNWQDGFNWDDPLQLPPEPTDVACIGPDTHVLVQRRDFCLGGNNPGGACDRHKDCPNGLCINDVCVGGSNNGQLCAPDVDCPGGFCDDSQSHVVVRAFRITGGGTDTSNDDLTMLNYTSLTITEDSLLQGKIGFRFSSELRLGADVEITGGWLVADFDPGPGLQAGRINPVDPQANPLPTLTLTGTTLRESWIVNVSLVNNGTVWAVGRIPLELKGPLNSGTGIWQSKDRLSVDVAELIFHTEVSGSGAFVLDGTAPRMEIGAPSLNLSGDIALNNGTLVINAPFATTGDLDQQNDGSLNVNADCTVSGNLSSRGTMTFAPGVVASFGAGP